MSFFLLNCSHCFDAVCLTSCLIVTGTILTHIGWAGEIQPNEHFFQRTNSYFYDVYLCLLIYPLSLRLWLWSPEVLWSPPVFPVFPASLLSTSISRAIKLVIKICSQRYYTAQTHSECSLCLKGHRRTTGLRVFFFNSPALARNEKWLATVSRH